MSSTVQAVVLAAGKGTRTMSARAKVLLPVLGQPLVEHVLRALAPLGANPTTLVVGHEAPAVPSREIIAGSAGDALLRSGGEAQDFIGACPDCGSQLAFVEGCAKCHVCGFSECG